MSTSLRFAAYAWTFLDSASLQRNVNSSSTKFKILRRTESISRTEWWMFSRLLPLQRVGVNVLDDQGDQDFLLQQQPQIVISDVRYRILECFLTLSILEFEGLSLHVAHRLDSFELAQCGLFIRNPRLRRRRSPFTSTSTWGREIKFLPLYFAGPNTTKARWHERNDECRLSCLDCFLANKIKSSEVATGPF